MTEQTTTAIHGAWVLVAEEGRHKLVADHWVLVENGRIAAIAKDRPRADRVIDRKGILLLPGLINLHNHCFSEMLVRNQTEDRDSQAFASKLIYGLLMPLSRLGIETLSAAERRAVARLGLLQIVKSGATTLMEPFRNGIAEMFDAAIEIGLRFYGAPYAFSTADPVLGADGKTDYRSSGADDGAADLARWDELHRAHDGAEAGRIKVVLSPHAADTCGPDLLRAVRARAKERDALITIHLAQSRTEMEALRQRYGRGPAEYLEWVGLLGPDLLAAHCILCNADELERLRRSDTTVINCPRTYARGGTPAPFARFAGRGIRTVIGTDGYNMDIIGEMTAAGLVSKLDAGNSGVATAGDLVKAVTLDAARALRRDDIGRIAPGARADLTAVDLSKPHFQPISDPIKALVWTARGTDVSTVMVEGRILVEDGRYALADESEIVAAGTAAIDKVWNHAEARALLHPT